MKQTIYNQMSCLEKGTIFREEKNGKTKRSHLKKKKKNNSTNTGHVLRAERGEDKER